MKPWWQSKTIWGALITFVALAVQATHHSMSQDQQDQLLDTCLKIVEGAGTLVSVYGRIKANQPIG